MTSDDVKDEIIERFASVTQYGYKRFEIVSLSSHSVCLNVGSRQTRCSAAPIKLAVLLIFLVLRVYMGVLRKILHFSHWKCIFQAFKGEIYASQ
jgi:hypothetical protein